MPRPLNDGQVDYEDGTPMSLDEENTLDISLYPNPTSNYVYIKLLSRLNFL